MSRIRELHVVGSISVSVDDFVGNLNVYLVSPYAAVQEAIARFRTFPRQTSKTFIYTGNCLNNAVMPILLHLGVGKQGAAHMIESAVERYGKEGFRYYYADERFEDGRSIFLDICGQAHAEFYYDLAMKQEQGPWEATFVEGAGYVDFEGRVGGTLKGKEVERRWAVLMRGEVRGDWEELEKVACWVA